MKGNSTEKKLDPHSEAKIDLICNYLAKQFNILKRSNYFDTVTIYDLFCGEGLYEDGKFGSPIRLIETLYKHYNFKDNQTQKGNLKFNFCFNDAGVSSIDKNIKKVDRVNRVISEKFPNYQNKCNISFKNLEADEYIKEMKGSSSSEIRTIILDPWGYTQFDYNILKQVIDRRTELIIFIPVSNIWRFLGATINNESDYNVEAINQFVSTLWIHSNPRSKNKDDFFIELSDKIKEFLGYKYNNFFQFTPGNSGQKYGLFLFSNNYRGYTKMLESMWEVDKENGRGFYTNSSDTDSLFSPIYLSTFDTVLEKYLKENQSITNKELQEFITINLKHLPKHANEVMTKMLKNGLKVSSLDGKKIRANNTYISNEVRKVKYNYV